MATLKAWRELILQYPFQKKQRHPSRFPRQDKSVDPEDPDLGARIARRNASRLEPGFGRGRRFRADPGRWRFKRLGR